MFCHPRTVPSRCAKLAVLSQAAVLPAARSRRRCALRRGTRACRGRQHLPRGVGRLPIGVCQAAVPSWLCQAKPLCQAGQAARSTGQRLIMGVLSPSDPANVSYRLNSRVAGNERHSALDDRLFDSAIRSRYIWSWYRIRVLCSSPVLEQSAVGIAFAGVLICSGGAFSAIRSRYIWSWDRTRVLCSSAVLEQSAVGIALAGVLTCSAGAFRRQPQPTERCGLFGPNLWRTDKKRRGDQRDRDSHGCSPCRSGAACSTNRRSPTARARSSYT